MISFSVSVFLSLTHFLRSTAFFQSTNQKKKQDFEIEMQAASSAWIWEKNTIDSQIWGIFLSQLPFQTVCLKHPKSEVETPSAWRWHWFRAGEAPFRKRFLRHRWDRWDWMILMEKTQGFGGLDFSGQIEKNPENWQPKIKWPQPILTRMYCCFFCVEDLEKNPSQFRFASASGTKNGWIHSTTFFSVWCQVWRVAY